MCLICAHLMYFTTSYKLDTDKHVYEVFRAMIKMHTGAITYTIFVK